MCTWVLAGILSMDFVCLFTGRCFTFAPAVTRAIATQIHQDVHRVSLYSVTDPCRCVVVRSVVLLM
eukprot:m.252280 g.252280  ORF g.252280 m.252280 type:complete len:66 (-) comp15471_c0_seq4:637-834(-)